MRDKTQPLQQMVRCLSSECRRWQSREVQMISIMCCSFCGGDLELVDMHRHTAALPQGNEPAAGGVVLEDKPR